MEQTILGCSISSVYTYRRLAKKMLRKQPRIRGILNEAGNRLLLKSLPTSGTNPSKFAQ